MKSGEEVCFAILDSKRNSKLKERTINSTVVPPTLPRISSGDAFTIFVGKLLIARPYKLRGTAFRPPTL